MKILVICQYYYPEPFRITDICEELVQRGHQVSVVTGTPNYPEGTIYPGYKGKQHRDEVVNGVHIHRCAIHPRKTGALHRFWNYYSFVFASKRYISRLKQTFDLVFINQLSPVMMAEAGIKWAHKNRRPSLLYCLDLWPQSLVAGGIRRNSAVYKVFLRISQRIYENVDRILLTSQGFAEYFNTELKIASDKLFYLPQYAEEQFDILPLVQKNAEEFHVLFAGNVGEMQSVETLVKAARKLADYKNLHIHIVGDGSMLESCKNMADGLENLTFHGRKDLSEMPGYYAMADILVVTLKADPILSTTLPGKVQSYLAAGKPVVGAINGETAAVIAAADCGLCGPAEDANQLATNIIAMCSDREQLLRWGEHGRQYYHDNFCKTAFFNQLQHHLDEICR